MLINSLMPASGGSISNVGVGSKYKVAVHSWRRITEREYRVRIPERMKGWELIIKISCNHSVEKTQQDVLGV